MNESASSPGCCAIRHLPGLCGGGSHGSSGGKR
jgi:hypothetical protein